MIKKNKLIIIIIVILFHVFVGMFHLMKLMPEGTNYKSDIYNVSEKNVNLLIDLTFLNNNQKIIHKHEIFDKIFYYIDNAEKYILIDMFLFNSYLGKSKNSYRELSKELTQKLIIKKKINPNIHIDFISDPINKIYQNIEHEEFKILKDNNINVIYTNLKKLRDSNSIYSTLWRIYFQWFGNGKLKLFKHPFSKDKENVTFMNYLSLLNFKANHRKIFMSDHDNYLAGIIMSANPHTASSGHSNIALEIKGDFNKNIYQAERSVAKFSNSYLFNLNKLNLFNTNFDNSRTLDIQLITEKQIKNEIIKYLKKLQINDELNIAMFYLSSRKIIKEIIKASKRGAMVRIILDPNKDAFGYKKGGIPNRSVASELVKKSSNKIKIRWYNTHGEQFHTKLVLCNFKDKTSVLMLGSSNLTRRNIDNYNLELDVRISGKSDFFIFKKTNNYFNTIWNNENNNQFTLDYLKYKDESLMKYIIYRFQEFTGISSY